jgi:hypothetical protein
MNLVIFGYIYQELYYLAPTAYNYQSPVVLPSETLKELDFYQTLFSALDFVLYSACTSVAVGYPRIASASAIVSLFNFIQVVTTFLIGALLVATFVQRNSPSDRDE